MKKLVPYLPSIAVLSAILAFSLCNDAHMSSETSRWRAQLDQADALVQEERWEEAQAKLTESYEDWSSRQTYLHIVSQHGAVDDAEAMYRRAMAFADTRELSEFRAELSDLRDQLRLLAEMERLSLKNVL